MKRFLVLCLAMLVLLTMGGCANKDAHSETAKTETSSQQENIEKVGWYDYIPSGTTNITSIGYCDLISSEPYRRVKMVDVPSDKTIGFQAYTMCPYCREETFVIFEADELPSDKLGDTSIVIQKSELCTNWANHANTFNSEYMVSMLLTLNK